MDTLEEKDIVTLNTEEPFWERFYMVSPLIVVGTQNEDDSYNLAPKHMAMPMGWTEYFGFICTPRHKTYRNAVRTGEYTVSYRKPSQVVLAMTILCASDPYAVIGVRRAFSMLNPDLVTGIATNTAAAVALLDQLTELPAFNIRDKETHSRLDALLRDRLDVEP